MDKDLPETFTLEKNVVPFKHTTSPKHVFLTGITGLVGAFLCSEILQKTSATVYCLVRSETPDVALKRVQDNLAQKGLWNDEYQPRIVPVLGDLTKPQLGINNKIYNELSRSVEAIYHCAAFVNHMLNYESMKTHNVNGTLSIITFAGNSKVKPIHFISSIAVCYKIENDSLSVHPSESAFDDGKNLVNGYGQTKWVSEHHLLQAREKGIPITIFRCGEITGSSLTGQGIAEDLFHNYLKIFSKAEAVPQWDGGVIDVVPVDYVSRTIFAVSRQSDCYGKIYHLTHPRPIPVQEYFAVLAKENPSWSTVSFEEWADRCQHYIKALPESPLRTVLLPFFTKNGSDHRMFEYYFQDPGLQNDNLQKALLNTEITFPQIDEGWWKKFLKQICF